MQYSSEWQGSPLEKQDLYISLSRGGDKVRMGLKEMTEFFFSNCCNISLCVTCEPQSYARVFSPAVATAAAWCWNVTNKQIVSADVMPLLLYATIQKGENGEHKTALSALRPWWTGGKPLLCSGSHRKTSEHSDTVVTLFVNDPMQIRLLILLYKPAQC